MCARMEKRAAINVPENMVLICNACNMEMTAAMQVIARREKCRQMGQIQVLEDGDLPGPMSDWELIVIGNSRIQRWLNSMDMVAEYSVWKMARLGELMSPTT